MWLSAILSAPLPFWFFLVLFILWTLTAFGLYRYWQTTSDLRKQGEKLHSQYKTAEALMKTLEARERTLETSIQELRAENIRLEQQIAELNDLKAEKYRLEQEIAELTERGPRLHGVWNNSETF